MHCENQLVIYCDICDSLCIQQFYKNHLKSKTHLNNIRKIENSLFLTSTSNPTERNNDHTINQRID